MSSSELSLVNKFKNLALQSQQPQGSGPMVIQSYSASAVQPLSVTTQQAQGEDVLKSLAFKIGLSENDIDRCYASRDNYDWCLALVSDSSTPPGTPFPSDLTNFFLRLIAKGAISRDKLKSLGLEKLLLSIVAGNVKQIFTDLSTKPNRQELASELDKTKNLLSKFSHVYPNINDKAEEIIKAVKQDAGVPADEKAIVDAIKGKIDVSSAAEKIIQSYKQATAPQAETNLYQKRGGLNSEQAVVSGKNNAQAPRAED
jgi:hypothetical protein